MGALVLSLLAVHCYLTTIKYSLGKPISVCLHNNKLLAFSVQLLNFFQHCNFVLLSSVQYKVTVEALVQYKYIIITSLYIFKSQSTSSCTIQIYYKLVLVYMYSSNPSHCTIQIPCRTIRSFIFGWNWWELFQSSVILVALFQLFCLL